MTLGDSSVKSCGVTWYICWLNWSVLALCNFVRRFELHFVNPGDWIFWTLPPFLILLNLCLGFIVFLGIGYGFGFSCVSWVFKSMVTMSFFGASVSITLEKSDMFGNSVVASFSITLESSGMFGNSVVGFWFFSVLWEDPMTIWFSLSLG